MTGRELFNALEDLTDEQLDREIYFYLRGPVGGLLDIQRLSCDDDDDDLTIDSFQMTERRPQ